VGQLCLRRILDIRSMTLSEMPTSVALPTSHHFRPSLSPLVSLSLGIFHKWMRMQMPAKPSSNLLQRTGGDHSGDCAQLGWRTFMITCLRWNLWYMRLDIWHKIGLSGDWCSGTCYCWMDILTYVTYLSTLKTSYKVVGRYPVCSTISYRKQ